MFKHNFDQESSILHLNLLPERQYPRKLATLLSFTERATTPTVNYFVIQVTTNVLIVVPMWHFQLYGDVCFHTVKNSLIVLQTYSCSMYVYQKRHEKKGDTNLRAQKARDRLSRQKGEGAIPKKGHRTSLRIESSFPIYHDQVKMQLFLKMRGKMHFPKLSRCQKISDRCHF